MSDKKHYQHYVNAVEYSQHLEQLLSIELKNTSALRERADKAERERDELREDVKAYSEHLQYHIDRQCKAEAELARRDAAAGEPGAYQIHSDLEEWRECTPERYAEVSSRPLVDGKHSGGWLVRKLYTAAQPAVVPDIEPFIEGALKLHGLRTAADGHSQLSDGFRSGARWAARELGAQQQKVVELPMPFDVEINLTRTSGDIEYQYHESGENFDRDEILAVLDAANVKYEVKK